MILHALYENGGLAPSDIESHIKDDIEKDGVKLVDMDKKMSQAYKDIVSHPPYFCPAPVSSLPYLCTVLSPYSPTSVHAFVLTISALPYLHSSIFP